MNAIRVAVPTVALCAPGEGVDAEQATRVEMRDEQIPQISGQQPLVYEASEALERAGQSMRVNTMSTGLSAAKGRSATSTGAATPAKSQESQARVRRAKGRSGTESCARTFANPARTPPVVPSLNGPGGIAGRPAEAPYRPAAPRWRLGAIEVPPVFKPASTGSSPCRGSVRGKPSGRWGGPRSPRASDPPAPVPRRPALSRSPGRVGGAPLLLREGDRHMRWPNDIIPRNPRELLEARREYTAEQLRNQLPANQQAAARQDALRLTKTEEAARERAAAVAAAQQEQAARRARFLGIYDRIQDAIRAAEGQRSEALLCGDVEAALAAQQRIDGLRPLIPALRDVARRDLGPSVHLAQLERV